MSATPSSPTAAGPAGTRSPLTTRRYPRRGYWVAVVVIALVVMALVRSLLVQSFFIPSASMEPGLVPGDRILVSRLTPGPIALQRGDVIVFDGTHSFALAPAPAPAGSGAIGRALGSVASALSISGTDSDYVKRVVGLPGDHVMCCDRDGRLTVNGVAVHEPYLFPGDAASDLTFDVIVPAGRLWVMGDHRSDSADSRAHLGDPGGGMVRLEDVIGRAVAIYWPLDRATILRPPARLSDIRTASPGQQ